MINFLDSVLILICTHDMTESNRHFNVLKAELMEMFFGQNL